MNTKAQHNLSIAVIGAGVSGLSAALHLSQHAKVSLFEAGKKAGGRAKSVANEGDDFAFLDNGQHILLGAYRQTRRFLAQCGVNEHTAFVRLPLQWHIASGVQLQAASGGLLKAIVFAKNLKFKQKMALIRQIRALQKMPSQPDISVAQFLRQQRCSRVLQSQFWQPLVLSAMNTPLQTASVQILKNILQDSVLANAEARELWLPKQDLSSIFAEPALRVLAKRGVAIHSGQRVRGLQRLANGKIQVNDEAFDRVVLAVAPYHAMELLGNFANPKLQTAYADLKYHAITTVYLRYAREPKLPNIITGLADKDVHWLFQRSELGGKYGEIAAVASCSEQIGDNAAFWMRAAHEAVQAVCGDVGDYVAARVITEKRATCAAKVGQTPPDCIELNKQGIYLAGDYWHARYPATIEAACQNAQAAAELLLHDASYQKRLA